MTVLQNFQYETDILLISPLDPHQAQRQILWPVKYLTNTSVYWSRLSIKSRSLNRKFTLGIRPSDVFQSPRKIFSMDAEDLQKMSSKVILRVMAGRLLIIIIVYL